MELTAIDDAIKCPICLSKYSKPITLPCGDTICMEHLANQSWTIDKKFKCDVCNNMHILPDEGFPINKTIEKMLQINLDKLDRGESWKNAKLAFDLLNLKFKSFEVIKNDPDFYIDEYFAEITNKIDIRREEVKLEVDNHFDKLLNYIKLTKKICNEMSETNKKVLNDEIDYFQKEIEAFDKDLKMLDSDDLKWKNIEAKTKILINKIDFNLKEMKNYFLLDQSYDYVCPKAKFDANILGHLEIIHNDNLFNLNEDIDKFNQSVMVKLNDGGLKKYKLIDYDEIISWPNFSPEQIDKVKSRLKLLERTVVTNVDQIGHTGFIKSIESKNKQIKNYIIASPRHLRSGDRYVTILKELNPNFAHEFLTGLGFGIVIKNGKFQQIN
jgi:hypothetical protein